VCSSMTKFFSNNHAASLCVAVCCSVLQCVAVCCSVLQCDAVCFNLLHVGVRVPNTVVGELQRVTVRCSE